MPIFRFLIWENQKISIVGIKWETVNPNDRKPLLLALGLKTYMARYWVLQTIDTYSRIV